MKSEPVPEEHLVRWMCDNCGWTERFAPGVWVRGWLTLTEVSTGREALMFQHTFCSLPCLGNWYVRTMGIEPPPKEES